MARGITAINIVMVSIVITIIATIILAVSSHTLIRLILR